MPTMRIGQADRNCQRQQGQPFPVCLPPTGEDTRKDDNKQLHAAALLDVGAERNRDDLADRLQDARSTKSVRRERITPIPLLN